MSALADRRFLFITGKGGVGKTTVTAALASALADGGRKVLIAICDAKERVSTLFGVPPIPQQITEIAPNIDAVRIEPELALREYGEMILRSKTVYNAVFENKYVKSFFKGVPGLSEWAVLGKAWYHSTAEAGEGGGTYDIVLFDAPATGHGLDMLRVPKVIVDVVPPGVLRRDAERAWQMFQDPKRAGVVVVTLPEDMPVNETLELQQALDTELHLPLALLVINCVQEELFSDDERHTLLQPRELNRDEPGDVAIAAGVRRAIRERVQAESLEKLGAAIDEPTVHLPLLHREAGNIGAVRELAGLLADAPGVFSGSETKAPRR